MLRYLNFVLLLTNNSDAATPPFLQPTDQLFLAVSDSMNARIASIS